MLFEFFMVVFIFRQGMEDFNNKGFLPYQRFFAPSGVCSTSHQQRALKLYQTASVLPLYRPQDQQFRKPVRSPTSLRPSPVFYLWQPSMFLSMLLTLSSSASSAVLPISAFHLYQPHESRNSDGR